MTASGCGLPTGGSAGALANHTECVAVSDRFRGALCERLAGRPSRRIRAGGFVYFQGDDAGSVFLLRSGLVKTSTHSSDETEVTLRIHRSNEIFGELCLCVGGRRDQARALEPSEVVEIPLPALLAQLERDPQAACDFTRSICERLGEAYEQLRSVSLDPVLARLARTLLALSASDEATTPDVGVIPHAITQDELARMIGARREVVSTLLNRLRESGLIRYTRRSPIQVDRSALSEFRRSIERE